MNINELTIGQAKELAALFSVGSQSGAAHPFIGKYVIARCYSAGIERGHYYNEKDCWVRDYYKDWPIQPTAWAHLPTAPEVKDVT